jgi:hypothetical protein
VQGQRQTTHLGLCARELALPGEAALVPRGLAALLGLPDERVADAGAAAAGEVLAGALREDARIGALPGRPLADLVGSERDG